MQILTIIPITVAFYFACCIFFPGIRCTWKGTRIACGPIGSLGMSILWSGLAAQSLFRESLSKDSRYLLMLLTVAGCIVTAGASIVAKRRAKREGAMQDLQRHLISKGRDHAA